MKTFTLVIVIIALLIGSVSLSGGQTKKTNVSDSPELELAGKIVKSIYGDKDYQLIALQDDMAKTEDETLITRELTFYEIHNKNTKVCYMALNSNTLRIYIKPAGMTDYQSVLITQDGYRIEAG